MFECIFPQRQKYDNEGRLAKKLVKNIPKYWNAGNNKVGIRTLYHLKIVFVPQWQKYNKEGRSDKGGNDCAIFNVYCNIWENQVDVGGIIDESTITALGTVYGRQY